MDEQSFLRGLVRSIPDFPRPGILFRDITPVLQNPQGLRLACEGIAERYAGRQVDTVVGIEARGFILASLVAYRLGVGFVPIRKPGKLPHRTVRETYRLEYGNDGVEMHVDALSPGQKVLLVDDVLATGGTMAACCRLVERASAQVVACAFLIELAGLRGREALANYEVLSLIRYEGA